MPKERFEVYQHGKTAIIEDFKKLTVYGSGKAYKKKLIVQDKGNSQAVQAFLSAVKLGKPSPISFSDIYAVMLTTFKAVESIRKSKPYFLKYN